MSNLPRNKPLVQKALFSSRQSPPLRAPFYWEEIEEGPIADRPEQEIRQACLPASAFQREYTPTPLLLEREK